MKRVRHDGAKLAEEAKAIVALAIRNGPIEDLHSCISQAEMKHIVKSAVDRVYSMLWFKERKPKRYALLLKGAKTFTSSWDKPELTTKF